MSAPHFAPAALACIWIAVCLSAPVASGTSVESELAFHRGVVAYGDGRYEQAREQFEKVVAADPDDLPAIRYLALIAQAQGEHERSLEYFDRAVALDPDDPDLRFDRATELLEAGQNEAAREAFAEVLAAQPDRARAHLFAGIAAYRLGDYEAALPALARAVELDPSLRLHARYYAGLAEAFSGNLPAADVAFADVESQSPQSPLAGSASTLRDQIRPQLPERPWDLAFTAGLEWDSNPTVVGDFDDPTVGDRDPDGRGIYRLRGHYRFLDRDALSLTAGYDGYLSTHFHETEVDLMTHVGWLSAGTEIGPVRLGMRYDFAYSFLDLDDRFRELHRATPTVALREGDWGVSQLFYQFEFAEFPQTPSQPAFDRDGERHTFGMNQYFFPPFPVEYLRVGVYGDLRDTDGTEYQYDGLEVNAGGAVVLPVVDVQLTLLYRFHYRDYSDASVIQPPTERDDFSHRLTFEAARPLGDHFEVSVGGSFSFNDSDVGAFDYNRHIVGGYVTYLF